MIGCEHIIIMQTLTVSRVVAIKQIHRAELISKNPRLSDYLVRKSPP